MCSLKSNLRVSAHWFIRESASGQSWQRRLAQLFSPNRRKFNFAAVIQSSIGTSLGCHREINQITLFSSVAYYGNDKRAEKRFLPSAATPELAASRPRAACRRETAGICRCRARARGFVTGSSLPGALRVGARRLRTALDWHSSSSFFFLSPNRYFSEISFFASKFTHLKWLALQLPTYYTIFDYSTLFASQPD